MVMWDFEGEVTFGKFPTDRTFTVVVFANRDEHSINFEEGEVVLDYTLKGGDGIPGLTLLDAGDFYGKFFSSENYLFVTHSFFFIV